jgi:hypothetical protein
MTMRAVEMFIGISGHRYSYWYQHSTASRRKPQDFLEIRTPMELDKMVYSVALPWTL